MIIRQIPADDILRHLPAIMDAKRRLRLGLHVHCHDMMVNAFGRLRAHCLAVDPQDVSPSMAAMMFAEAWSIVHQVELMRQAMEVMPASDTVEIAAFLEEAAQARLMRSAMDHMSQRISTIANRSGASEALFGTLTFVRSDAEQLGTIVEGENLECELVVLAYGTMPGFEGDPSPALVDQEIDQPITNLRLSAAGAALRLDFVCAHLTGILNTLSKGVKAAIHAETTEITARAEHSKHELCASAPVIVGSSTSFTISF